MRFVAKPLAFVIIICCFTLSLLGQDLSEDIIKSSRRVMIFEGTFDPVTKGHVGLARKIIENEFAGIIVIIPGEMLSSISKSQPLDNEMMRRMMILHQQVAEQYNLSGIMLDLNLDNIIVRDCELVLVDLGVLPSTVKMNTLGTAQRDCGHLFQI